jgi:hypothetical protein
MDIMGSIRKSWCDPARHGLVRPSLEKASKPHARGFHA